MRGAKKLAFEAFDRGDRPSQLKIKGLKRTSGYRYYQLWKKQVGAPPSPQGGSDTPQGQAPSPDRPEEAGVLTRYGQFIKRQELETEKNKLREMVEDWVETLEEAQGMYEQAGISIKGWKEKRERLEGQLGDFLLAELERVTSQEELKALAQVADGVESEVIALLEEYEEKHAEHERLLQQREQETSLRLLQDRLALGPLFPSWLPAAIAKRIIVHNQAEAETVFRAVTSYAAKHLNALVKPENRERVWREFVTCLDQDPWQLIKELAATDWRSVYPPPPSYFRYGLPPA